MASGSRKVIYAALVGNAFIAATKFMASVVTGSSAMLSEGIHSLVDVGNQVLLLYGLRRAAKPPDDVYPFGHGKEVYFWSFVVAILIFAVGAGISIYEGIDHLLDPHPVENPVVNYVVLALAIVFESFSFWFAFVEFRKEKGDWGYLEAVRRGKDPTGFVVLFEDSAAMAGLVVALVGLLLAQWTGIIAFDGLASIAIGAILGGTAIWLAYETKGLLIGESANRDVVRGIREIAHAHSQVRHVNEVLTLHMGPEFILVTVSLAFEEIPAAQLEATVDAIDSTIKETYPEVKRVFIEVRSVNRAAI